LFTFNSSLKDTVESEGAISFTITFNSSLKDTGAVSRHSFAFLQLSIPH